MRRLLRLLCGTVVHVRAVFVRRFGVPFGVLFRVLFHVPSHVPFHALFRVPFHVPFRVASFRRTYICSV